MIKHNLEHITPRIDWENSYDKNCNVFFTIKCILDALN